MSGGILGAAAPVLAVFLPFYEVTGEGASPEPLKGSSTHDLTGNHLRIHRGEAVKLTKSNLKTADNSTGFAGPIYTVSNVAEGYFARRSAAAPSITTFSQTEVYGGIIRFVRNGGYLLPSYAATVSDGCASTAGTGVDLTKKCFVSQSDEAL